MMDLPISNAYYSPSSRLGKSSSRRNMLQSPGMLESPSECSVENNKELFGFSFSDLSIIPDEACPALRQESMGKEIQRLSNLRKSLAKLSPPLHGGGKKMLTPPAPPSPSSSTSSDEHWSATRLGRAPRRSLSSSFFINSDADKDVHKDRWLLSSPQSAASPSIPIRKKFSAAAIVSPPSRWKSPQDSSPKSPCRAQRGLSRRRLVLLAPQLSCSSLSSISTATMEDTCSISSLSSTPKERLRKGSEDMIPVRPERCVSPVFN